MTKIKPFLKWAGSKFNCIQHILASLPQGKRLIEPFAGSGVVFMNTGYSAYILGETNQDLIQLYTLLQQNGEPFIHYCQNYFRPETNLKEKYYELRAQFNSTTDLDEKAALFLYLNRHGYNGLCRYNSKGSYNVPFGLHKHPYFPLLEMHAFYNKCHNVQFIHNDFKNTFALVTSGDVVYCDPPYVPITLNTGNFQYTEKPFTEDDQRELAQLARSTANKGIPVILSNHDTELTRSLYEGSEIKSFGVARLINCQTDNRKPVRELLAVFR